MASEPEHVREALALAGLTGAEVAPAQPDSRNEVWFLDSNREGRLVLKLPAPEAEFLVRREAEILRRLQGKPLVPDLIALGPERRPFLVTRQLPGVPLRERLRTGDGAEPPLAELATWLRRFSELRSPRDFLASEPGATGPWAQDYAPPGAPELTEPRLVHGSLDPGNILVTATEPQRLTGLVDFEATRLGSSLLDVAGLALHLILEGRPQFATRWLEETAYTWDRPDLRRAAWPYLSAQNDRRQQAGATFLAPAALGRWVGQQSGSSTGQ